MEQNVYPKDPSNVLRDFYRGGPFVISPSGNFLISSYRNEAIIVGLHTSHVLGKVRVNGYKITAIAISPDGKTFFTACQTKRPLKEGQNTVIFDQWDLSLDWSSPPTRSNTWEGEHTNSVRALTIFEKPDGDLLVASGMKGGRMRVWIKDGKLMRMLEFDKKRHMDRIVCIKFCRTKNDFYIISSSKDVRIWEYGTKKFVAKLKHKGDGLCIFETSNDGERLFTYGSDEVVKIWDMNTFHKMGAIKLGEKAFALCIIETNGVFAKSISSMISERLSSLSYLFVTLSKTGEVSVWNSETRRKLLSLNCPVTDKDFSGLVMIEQGFEALLFLTEDRQFLFCNVQESKHLLLKKRLMGLTSPLKAFKFAGESDQFLLVAPTRYEHIRMYDLESMSCCSYLNIDNNEENGIEIISSFDCLTINGKCLIVTASDLSVRLFVIQNDQFIEVGYGRTEEGLTFTNVVFSRNRGNFFITGRNESIFSYWKFDPENLEAGSTLYPVILCMPEGSIISVAISPNDEVVCFGSIDSNIYVLEWENPGASVVQLELEAPYEGHFGAVTSVEFCPQGCDILLILSVTEDEIKMWKVSDGECLWTVYSQTEIQRALFMTLDNTIYICGSTKSHIQFWKVNTGDLDDLKVDLNLAFKFSSDDFKISSFEVGRKSGDLVTLHHLGTLDDDGEIEESALLYRWDIGGSLS